jgi:tRNA-splicing ligase RtcB
MIKVISTERVPIKLWLDDIDKITLEQSKNLANLPHTYRWVAVMPDAHPGYGMPIGGILPTEDIIVPNAVGVDIGCGIKAIKTSLKEIEKEKLTCILEKIRATIPIGFKHHKIKQEWDGFKKAPEIEIIQREIENAKYQLGTLGSGNHFIEILKDDEGYIWIMIHSGSRNFGLKTAEYFYRKARKLVEEKKYKIPSLELSFLPFDSKEGQDYFTAMNYCLEFAKANRDKMAKRIMEIFKEETKSNFLESIDVHHNYASLEEHFGKEVLIHRKGAIRAGRGDIGIIPGSMGTPSYIVEGLGNQESFLSSSHGAGRKLGRKEAVRTLSLEKEIKKMGDIIGKPRTQRELEEAPGAYKDIEKVMENQRDLVKIKQKLNPIAVIIAV